MKRMIPRLVIIVCIVAMAVVEILALRAANLQYQQEQAGQIATQLKLELNNISNSVQRGDLAAYTAARQRASAQFEAYRQNVYATKERQVTIDAVANYLDRLSENDEQASSQIRLRAAIRQLAVDAIAEADDATFVAALQQDVRIIKENASQPNLVKYADHLDELLAKTAPCIDICTRETFASLQAELQDLQMRYQERLDQANDELAETYSPRDCILLLE